MIMRFLPDEAISDDTEDFLGFSDFVNLLKLSIYNTQTPFVYGVLGDWGVGKTSILQLLKNRLINDLDSGRKLFIPIWFNAWKYENETNIIYPLLYAIKQDYIKRFKSIEMKDEFWRDFTKVATASIAVLTDLGLRVATKRLAGEAIKLDDITKQVQATESLSSELESILSEWADQVNQINQAFAKLLDAYSNALMELYKDKVCSKDEIVFVFIIDDLDRCLPETTISILEGIKNYLSVERCVYILGLNPNIIYQGIRIKYKGLEVDGREYLEKILNYSFYVPEPQIQKIPEFVLSRFNSLIINESVREKYKSMFIEFGEILEKCRFNNPRKIKRVLNRYLFFLNSYEKEIYKYYNSNIVRLIILAEYFPGLFQLFLKSDNITTSIKSELMKIGQLDFKLEEFEKRFGISIVSVYPQLSKMNELFNLNLNTTGDKLSITKNAQNVFCITRLT
ncbi:KAP family P-loop NTPase fold protein [Nostoc sp. CALU 1950]|uniref:KAP family P-loop NTPase fold protein n=1 Tax=Nostoc sp. CALU 1950 TaxID=3104321 RepID=UPI003EBCF1E8